MMAAAVSRDDDTPAPDTAGAPLVSAEAVRRSARNVLPTAPKSYEARPVVLDQGLWVVSVAAGGQGEAGARGPGTGDGILPGWRH